MFEESLKRIQESVEGVRVVLLVDRDGMVVSALGGAGDSRLELIAASYMDIARRVSTANQEAEMEPPEELMVTGSSGAMLFRAVSREYGLLALLGPESVLGLARFELRKAASSLLPELAS